MNRHPARAQLRGIRSLTLALATWWIVVLPAQVVHGQISPGDLAQPHAGLEGITNCTKCHELGRGPSPGKCLSCHANVKQRIDQQRGFHHTAMQGDDAQCGDCHADHAGRDFALIRWPGGEAAFDHTRAGFDLQGRHARLQCRDCHRAELIHDNLRSAQRDIDLDRTYLGLPRDCLGCHQDEHRQQLSINCTECHGAESWKPTTGFDHDRTAFRLTGTHEPVQCAGCHPALAVSQAEGAGHTSYAQYIGLRYENCSSCHKDPHRERFGGNCRSCHDTGGWKRITTAEVDHARTDFPLLGRHAHVPCKDCHTSGSYLQPVAFALCTDCHRDQHRGQFALRTDGGMCESCHSVQGFKPATFGMAEHAQTKFALVAAHSAQSCLACHEPTLSDDLGPYRRYTFEDRRCVACHDDTHHAQFASDPVKVCTDCHGGDSWRVRDFDHDRRTTYPLEGAHQKVACQACHKPTVTDGDSFVTYRAVGRRCESCHEGTTPPRLVKTKG